MRLKGHGLGKQVNRSAESRSTRAMGGADWSDRRDTSAFAALAVDNLSPLARSHPRAKAEHPHALDSADSARVVHRRGLRSFRHRYAFASTDLKDRHAMWGPPLCSTGKAHPATRTTPMRRLSCRRQNKRCCARFPDARQPHGRPNGRLKNLPGKAHARTGEIVASGGDSGQGQG